MAYYWRHKEIRRVRRTICVRSSAFSYSQSTFFWFCSELAKLLAWFNTNARHIVSDIPFSSIFTLDNSNSTLTLSKPIGDPEAGACPKELIMTVRGLRNAKFFILKQYFDKVSMSLFYKDKMIAFSLLRASNYWTSCLGPQVISW